MIYLDKEISMKKLLALIVCTGFSTFVFSETILTYGQTSVTCPKSVICDSAEPTSCHLLDNPYDLWDKPTLLSSTTALKGNYPLAAVTAYNTNNKISCSYSNGSWDTFRAFVVTFKYPESTYFNKLKKASSNWNDDGHCFPSDMNTPLDPTLCPVVEAPGVSVFDETNIKLFYPNPNSYFEPNFIAGKWLSYDQLYSHCGANSDCIIDIGQCDKENENCDSYGMASFDISAPNIVKINKINSFKVPGNPYVFKQKQPFNMIYSEVSK